jgi:hypothetical protein
MVVFADAEEQKRIDFLRKREEEELAQMLSRKYGVEYVDLSLVAVNTDALRLIPELRHTMPRRRCLAASASASTLLLARPKILK